MKEWNNKLPTFENLSKSDAASTTSAMQWVAECTLSAKRPSKWLARFECRIFLGMARGAKRQRLFFLVKGSATLVKTAAFSGKRTYCKVQTSTRGILQRRAIETGNGKFPSRAPKYAPNTTHVGTLIFTTAQNPSKQKVGKLQQLVRPQSEHLGKRQQRLYSRPTPKLPKPQNEIAWLASYKYTYTKSGTCVYMYIHML